MDVNLTISLMRGQMGLVIEKAVNAAVETVLGEMIRVMSLKFEQLRKEITVKEKENEDIRKMLESTRCQMKILRQKYVNALNTKDDRQAFAPHRHTLLRINPTRHAAGQLDAARHAGVQLDGARHAGVQLDGARQAGVQLDGARQAGVQLGGARQAGVQLDGARHAGVQLDGARHAGVQLDGARQAGVQLDGARQAGVQLDGARHAGVQLDGARHAGVQLDGARQAGVQLDGARQAGVQLDAARHAGVQLDAARQAGVQLDGARHAGVQLDGARHAGVQLDGARHAGVQLDAARHAGVQLDTVKAHQVIADHSVPPRRRSSNTGSPCAEPLTLTLAFKPQKPEPIYITLPDPKTHKVIHEGVPTESCQSAEIGNEEVPGLKVHLGLKVENSSSNVPASNDPLWGQIPQTPTETEHKEMADPSLPLAHTSETLNPANTHCQEPASKIKQEEAEVEIVEVKEEPAEPSTSEIPRIELHQHLAGAGLAVELPVTQQCVQTPSVMEPAFMGVDPNTYSESQLAVADTQRQMYPFCKDLMLYEDYKRKRIEVRKRSETRRRELERALPQALLADLVKERREKTRLRVARWRAKRKLQACLMAQAAQFNNTQAIYTQHNGRRGGAAPQQGGINLSTAQSETGVYTMPLQMGTSPILTAQRLGMVEGQMQPGASVFVQQRTSAAGSDTHQ